MHFVCAATEQVQGCVALCLSEYAAPASHRLSIMKMMMMKIKIKVMTKMKVMTMKIKAMTI